MKIASWNVNSIKARSEHVLRWLATAAPDILLLQELKGLEFPAADFALAGYESVCVPQKAYNGVAVLSKGVVKTVLNSLPGDISDSQARYLEIEKDGLRIINIYAPNGNPAPSEKYVYKLGWMVRLVDRVRDLRTRGIPFLIGGDFNVIPMANDCYNPASWNEDALYRIETRRAFRALIHQGLTDAFRIQDGNAGRYTFWDYQGGAWTKNHGIRIDHFLLSPSVTDRFESCVIDTGPRGWDKPSDHVPVVLEIAS